ncbi:EAL domain-containing protein [Gluconacetobacter tumulicola]|uniref:EAL domain-containing protein n=1 Tax=Gluconacetobacter tumulicola TaxID=1017177 RepID=A0A7W4JEX8_9PROT|nr:EAL domain-containing protein [Gluconacetobacter tumulicola]MBB2180022.1 EAL domain-containing protein [Gluconacetobacter tumulicola]
MVCNGPAVTLTRLEIEVTETAPLGDEHRGFQDLLALREMGGRVSLDDFGTGYSSLAHLRTFSFDKIKIDGSFVRDALERSECAAVVRAIADLGKRLGVRIVAEGVETEDQLALVRAEGCREVQGYLYGRPARQKAVRGCFKAWRGGYAGGGSSCRAQGGSANASTK